MAETRSPAAIDAIAAALLADGLAVFDGPIVNGDQGLKVFIGYDGDPAGDFLAASTTQAWSGIGQRKRDETITIRCAIVSGVGNDDTSWKPVRDTVYAAYDQIGSKLRSNASSLGPSLGLPAPSVAECMTEGSFFQEPTENGMQGRLTFTITYQTRV